MGRGRKVLQTSKWAIEQIEQGKTIHELLPEFRQRHAEETGYELVDAQRSLRAVWERHLWRVARAQQNK